MNANNPSVQFLLVIAVYFAVLVLGHLWHANEMKKGEMKKVKAEK